MKPIVVVSGVIANKPHNGGNARMVLNWLVGLERLGVDVYFVEQLSSAASVDDAGGPAAAAESANRAYFDRVLRRYGFERRSALVCDATSALDDARVCGLSKAELKRPLGRCGSADQHLGSSVVRVAEEAVPSEGVRRRRSRLHAAVAARGGATRRSRHVLHRRPTHWHARLSAADGRHQLASDVAAGGRR